MSLATSIAALTALNRESPNICTILRDIQAATTWLGLLNLIKTNIYWDFRAGLVTDAVIADAPDGDRLSARIYYDKVTTYTNPGGSASYFLGLATDTIVNLTAINHIIYLMAGKIEVNLSGNFKVEIYQSFGTELVLNMEDNSVVCLISEEDSIATITMIDDCTLMLTTSQTAGIDLDLDDNAHAEVYAFGDSVVVYSLAGASTLNAHARDQGYIGTVAP